MWRGSRGAQKNRGWEGKVIERKEGRNRNLQWLFVQYFQIKLEFGMLAFVEGGKPENLEMNPHSKGENQQKLNPHIMTGPGIEPGPHWWEATALTTASSLLPSRNVAEAGNTQTGWEPDVRDPLSRGGGTGSKLTTV